MLLSVLLVAILAPLIAPYDPLEMHVRNRLAPPSREHLCGTDHYGSDIFSRIVFGTRTSLLVGGLVALANVTMGTLTGLLTGYFRGALDMILMRIMDAWMVFPSILLAMAIMATLGPSLINIIIALSIVYTPRTTRIVRSTVLKISEIPYVEAAKAVGCTNFRILLRTILPNCLAPLIVQATFIFAYAILAEAMLSFLGVGAPPEVQSWGTILNQGRPFIYVAPWYMIFPGSAITYVVLGLNLLGDGLRDAWDPKLRRKA